ncbi:putative LRR receptor-like protein kinase [Trifolium pratense]|uniref:non-specific serine/threonine protein kinase n=1 Tax=Trifolium pratense TaxID=57577 RepID=A0A2K3MYT3_TRIPR|nr:putative LRR receptor-like protein kinase [Trifolium pratense]
MRVTEKCDVYSFGVVVLEILMGKHPGEFLGTLYSNKSLTLMEMLVKDVVDQRLPPPIDTLDETIVFTMRVALACTRAAPESRPTMRSVARELSTSTQDYLPLPFGMITVSKLTGFQK